MQKVSTMKGEHLFRVMLLPLAVGSSPEYLRLGQHDRINFRTILKSRCAECLSLSWTFRYEVYPASPHFFPACPSISVCGRFCRPTATNSSLLLISGPSTSHFFSFSMSDGDWSWPKSSYSWINLWPPDQPVQPAVLWHWGQLITLLLQPQV